MALIALNLPVNTLWLGAAVVLCVLMLYKRNLLELALIAILAALAEMHSVTSGVPRVSPDILLAVLITVIILPSAMEFMGLAAPNLGRLVSSH
jgi:hypothetical protein